MVELLVEAVAVVEVVEVELEVVDAVAVVEVVEVDEVVVLVVVVVEDVVLIALLPKSIASHSTVPPVPVACLEVVISLAPVSSARQNEASFWPAVSTHCIL